MQHPIYARSTGFNKRRRRGGLATDPGLVGPPGIDYQCNDASQAADGEVGSRQLRTTAPITKVMSTIAKVK